MAPLRAGIIAGITLILLVLPALTRAQPKSPQEEVVAAARNCDLVKVRTLTTEHPGLLQTKDNSGTLLHQIINCNDLSLAQFLIDQRVPIDAVDSNGRTPLSYAVAQSNLALVKLLVANHANVNLKDSFGFAPLLLGNAAVARFLLSSGADPNAVDQEGRTVLHYKPERALIELLKTRQFNFNLRDVNGKTPLHIAAKGAATFCSEKKNRNWSWSTAGLEDVRALLAAGAEVNVQDSAGVTPLMEASNYQELVLMLLRRGANINARDAYVGSVLHRLVEKPFPYGRSLYFDHHSPLPPPCGLDLDPMKKLEFFLSHGADPNVKGHDGLTVLATLAKPSDGRDVSQAVKLLLAHHADLMARDEKGNSVLHLAAAAKNFGLVELFLSLGVDSNVKNSKGETPLHQTDDLEVASLLLKHKANPHAEDEDGKLPIHHAVESGPPELVKLLLDLKTYSSFGDVFSTLHVATRRGNVEIMEALLKAGAIIDRMGMDRQTPLHEAAANPTSPAIENVKFLIANGAKVNTRDGSNDTPLHYALNGGPSEAKLEAARFLLASGADPNIKDVFGRKPLDFLKDWKQYQSISKEFDDKLNEFSAALATVTVDVPQRKVFGQIRMPDGTPVNGSVSVKDAESYAKLGWVETKTDGRFEFLLPEGQQFRIVAHLIVEKDGQQTMFYMKHESQSKVFIVKGDVGPMHLVLDGVLRRNKSPK